MRVLVTGAHGQVGQELLRLAPGGFNVLGLGSAQLDISDAAQVATVVQRHQPQLIINAAAYTAVDKAEAEPERAFAVNANGVAHLAQAGVPVLHISTDYVFAGDACTPYCEADATAPSSAYGASKYAGEQALIAANARHIILRTSWVFGAQGANFVKTMLRLGAERDTLRVVADQHGGPTAAASIAQTLWALALQYRHQGSLHWGTYHYSGAPACSWHTFAKEIFRQAHAQGLLARLPTVEPIATCDYPTPAKRPAWSVLDCSKLLEHHGISQPNWQDDLAQMLSALAPPARPE